MNPTDYYLTSMAIALTHLEALSLSQSSPWLNLAIAALGQAIKNEARQRNFTVTGSVPAEKEAQDVSI